MVIKLPKLDRTITIVSDKLTPTLAFHQWWQTVVKTLEGVLNQLQAAIDSIEDALEAAGIAQEAAEAAQDAADAATAAAVNVGGIVTVVNSGTDINPLSATDAGASATIIVATHNRVYGDGTSVSVTGASLTGKAYSTQYWVYYDDPSRAGGSVAYVATTIENDAAQVGNRHLVGAVLTPAALGSDTDGRYNKPPGLNFPEL